MRVWKYTEYAPPLEQRGGISARGLHLMMIEFLVRHPGTTCVLTSPPPGLASLVGLFPNTLFHVYRLFQAEDESVSNVVHHPCVFDKDAAIGWSIRPGSFSLIFVGEGMDRQMALHLTAVPRVALLFITEAPEYYIEGEVMYPLWCSQGSLLCGLVATSVPGGTPKAFRYGETHYTLGMREFQEQRRAAGEGVYDASMENMILSMYCGTQCADPDTASLLSEIVRVGLPPKDGPDIRAPC